MTEEWDLYLRSGIYGFLFVFGILGNLFVIFFFGFKMNRAPNFRWFVVHLAIADCTYAIMTPLQMLYLMLSGGEWHLGLVLCKMTYIGPITVNVSALILCFMAYERYRVICHPFKEPLSKRVINLIVGGIWILCILIKVPVMNRLHIFVDKCIYASSNSFEHLMIALSFLVFESVLPLLLLIIFFFRITYALKESDRFRTKSQSGISAESRRRRSSTPSFYSGMGAPPTPKWKPPLSPPPPLVTLEECESTDYVNFTQAHRRGRISETGGKQSGVHFSFHRGRLYSGNSRGRLHSENSSYVDDVFESVSSQQDIPSSSSADEVCDPPQQHYSHLKDNFRTGYLHLKQFIKHSNAPSLDVARHFGIQNKQYRNTISALFCSVLMFALTSIPYNLNYFIITCVYLYSPNAEDIDEKYGIYLVILNEWLGVIMLSGCIMNIIIYSGKFPKFRFQMYQWASSIGQKLSWKNCRAKENNELLGPKKRSNTYSSQNQTFVEHCEKDVKSRPECISRTENNYIKVWTLWNSKTEKWLQLYIY